jgi:hypothetical protein
MDLGSFMKANGLDDAAMAVLIGGCSASAVKKWRYRERVPRSDHLHRIAEATGGQVTANDLLGGAPRASGGAVAPVAPAVAHENEALSLAQRSREVLTQQLDDSSAQLARQRDPGRPAATLSCDEVETLGVGHEHEAPPPREPAEPASHGHEGAPAASSGEGRAAPAEYPYEDEDGGA